MSWRSEGMNMDKIEAEIKNIVQEIKWYFIIMLLAVIIHTYFVSSIAVVWAINFTGLVLIFGNRLRKVGCGWFRFISLYLLFSVLTFLFNIEYFNGSLKSIGTNVNLIVTPIYIILLFEYSSIKPFSDNKIFDLFNFISALGLFSVAFAWITGYRDIIRVVYGSMNAYQAEASGLFFGKNIYGAFISLSASVDLYQYVQSRKTRYLALFVLKFVAVMVSFSRAALLQAVLFSFLFLWMNRKSVLHDWMLIIIVVLLFAVAILMNQQILNNFIKTFVRFEAGDAGRAAERSRAISAIGNNILEIIFGVGFSGLDSLSLDIDNTFLYLFFTGGIIKCTFFVYLFIHLFHYLRRLKIYNASLSNYCLAMAFSYFAYAFFESVAVFELGILNYMFTFFIFMIPSGYHVVPENDQIDNIEAKKIEE